MFTQLGAKNLEILHEMAPNAAVIGVLVNPNNPNTEPQLRDLRSSAQMLGLRIVTLAAGSDREIDGIFATLEEQKIEAMLVTADGFFFGLQDKLVPLTARHAMPTVFPLSDYVVAGGLISYGTNLAESWRQTGLYVGKVVRGTRTTDLPVIQSAKFELVINLKTAKALKLEIPPKLLALADNVIE
jgi:putative tryptophan/tyrosine transport system substrate-binding protein